MNENPLPPAPQKSSNAVAITAIIATTIVLLTCIAGCTSVFIAFATRIH